VTVRDERDQSSSSTSFSSLLFSTMHSVSSFRCSCSSGFQVISVEFSKSAISDHVRSTIIGVVLLLTSKFCSECRTNSTKAIIYSLSPSLAQRAFQSCSHLITFDSSTAMHQQQRRMKNLLHRIPSLSPHSKARARDRVETIL
jgi:hypothetical protein